MKKPRFTKTYEVTIVTEGDIPHLADHLMGRMWSLEREGGRLVDITVKLVLTSGGVVSPVLTSPSEPVPKFVTHPLIEQAFAEPLREAWKNVEQASGLGTIECSIPLPSVSGNGHDSFAPPLVNMDAIAAILAEGLNKKES